MRTLQIQKVNLSFGEREILKDVSFTLSEKSRAALVGANGSGKSTLLKTIAGTLQAESISISITKDARVAYLPQSDIVFPESTVYEAAEEGYRRFDKLLSELRALEETTASGEEAMRNAGRMSEIHDTLTSSGYYDRKSRIESILFGLGFTKADLTSSACTFSGGWQMRIALARILVEAPDFLLLDEPTNYLDIEAMVWLEEYLKSFDGGIMLVSHDQRFLDDMTDETYEIFNGRLKRYAGNYSAYLVKREEELKELEKKAKKQQDEIKRTEEFIERFRYKATKSRQVQSRVKMLEKIEEIEIPAHLKKLSFTFPPSPHSGNDVLYVDQLSKAYGDHVIFSKLSFLVRKGERLAITGKNGTGKTTLLRILAAADTDYTGMVRDGAGVAKAYFAQDNDTFLTGSNSVLEEAEAEADTKDIPSVRNLLGAFLFTDDDVFKKVSVLSGGEKSRLSLLKILLHPSNLLLLDEPTNHLDINAKEMLEKAIASYGGTVIFVSHDRHFIKSLATRILYLTEEGPEFFEGDYDYFEYKLKEREERFLQKKETKKAEEAKPSPGLSHAELKARRNRIKTLERECDKLLETLEGLNTKAARIDDDLALPENYTVPARINALLKDKETLEKQIAGTEERWLDISSQLEELNGQDS